MNTEFWRGRRVFLTGHTGFKGGWLSLWLQHAGAQVTGFALAPSTQPNLFTEARVADGMHSFLGDIRDLAALEAVMVPAQPEVVIHMAAQPLVRYSYQNPVETYATNVMGTVHVLEVVRKIPSVKAVLVITTDKCYENREWDWGYRENEPMGGYDPYSNSKGCAELVCAAYRSSFFNPNDYARHGVGLATARAGNVIGGGDWSADRLVPDILRAWTQGQPVHIRNPHAIRPWQHVLEPLRGYLSLAEKLFHDGPSYSQGWNFGPSDDDAQSVGAIVEQMATLWGPTAQWAHDPSPQPHEAHYLKLDISKARNQLLWHPVLRLTQALQQTVAWASQHQAGTDMRAATLAQIQSYQAQIQS
ncbi:MULTISPECIES: CDP-glucose 4,6-dehydratase [Giesbergeria]|uniref:CDP-glucose 4,6-dehydratase n=1 Tax=Giesbergeria sinuosa TaxID=80883 RepID=A0ABV9QCQ3_9BURK